MISMAPNPAFIVPLLYATRNIRIIFEAGNETNPSIRTAARHTNLFLLLENTYKHSCVVLSSYGHYCLFTNNFSI
jgi:hypothetical protein